MNAQVKLSTDTLKQTTVVVRGDMNTGNKWLALSDMYRGDGVTAAMLETTKNGGNEAIREQVKGAIVAAFTPAQQKLLSAETKALSDSDKGLKKTLQQSIGAYVAKIKAHLAKAESAESEDTGSTKTDLQKIHEALDKVLKKLQALEAPKFNVTDAVKAVTTAKGIIPAA